MPAGLYIRRRSEGVSGIASEGTARSAALADQSEVRRHGHSHGDADRAVRAVRSDDPEKQSRSGGDYLVMTLVI